MCKSAYMERSILELRTPRKYKYVCVYVYMDLVLDDGLQVQGLDRPAARWVGGRMAGAGLRNQNLRICPTSKGERKEKTKKNEQQ